MGTASEWILTVISSKSGEIKKLRSFKTPARAAAWLPDGRGILVVALEETGRGQIWFVSYPQGEISRFTNDLTNYDTCCLDVTRDGDSLVAVQDTTLSDIWVAKGDGSETKQITSGEALGLALDWVGNRIAAVDPRLQWITMNADGSNQSQLTNDHDIHLQLSACPDGKHVLYTTVHEGKADLWRVQADGSSPVKLPATGLLFGAAICSPDSQSAIYVADNAIWSIPLEGGKPTKLNVPLAFSGYSPDGKLLFYISQTHQDTLLQSNFVVTSAAGGAPLYNFDGPLRHAITQVHSGRQGNRILANAKPRNEYLGATVGRRATSPTYKIPQRANVRIRMVRGRKTARFFARPKQDRRSDDE